MYIDIISAAIFGFFAMLIFRYTFSTKATIALGFLAGVLPLIATTLYAYLPYAFTETAPRIVLTPSINEIIVTVLRCVVAIVALLMIRRDTENFTRFVIWLFIAIFINSMLLPTLLVG